MGPFSPGQSVRFSVTATLFGALANPPSLVLTVHGPDDTFLVPAVVNDSTGQYHADAVIPITSRGGWWAARWVATGGSPGNNAVTETTFVVQSLAF
jgi:hypothetical protein